MAQFQSFAPDIEVRGETILPFLEGVGAFRASALKTLAQHGIENPEPGRWYRLQSYLDAYRWIAEKVGPATLRRIGAEIPDKAVWPPDVDSVEKALLSIDVAYHMNHRGGEIGHYRFEKTGERSGRMVCHNPYPCSFDRGLIEAAARKFAPGGSRVMVVHDDKQPCRDKEGDSCTLLIEW